MDVVSLDLAIFLIATFAGALVAGLSGFAFGLVAASIWLYILTPLQTATLIVAFGLIVQGYAVWKLRHALDWGKLWPFLAGAVAGVPAGIFILGWASPVHVKAGIGVLLVLYSLYALLRPKMPQLAAGGAGHSGADRGVHQEDERTTGGRVAAACGWSGSIRSAVRYDGRCRWSRRSAPGAWPP